MRAITATPGSIARDLIVIAAMAMIARGTALSAQSLSSHATAGLRILSANSTAPRQPRQIPRLYSAATYGLAGALVFGSIGYFVGGQCKRACNVLSKNRVVGGIAIGEILGSTYGAARARGGGHCTHTERIGMGLGGAGIGALASIGTAQIPPGRISILAVVPLGSVMFMSGC